MSIATTSKHQMKEKGKNMPRFASYPDQFIHQADLLFLKNDKGYKYALVIVDIGSRLLDAEPLKTKSSVAVLKGIQAIYDRGPLKLPHGRIEVDDGSEFKASVSAWFKKKKIPIRVAKTARHRQQAIVERKNQALGDKIDGRIKYQERKTKQPSSQWTSYLKIIVKKMNEKQMKENEKKKKKKKQPDPAEARIVKTDKDGKEVEHYPCKGDSCNALEQGTRVRVALEIPRDELTGKRLHGKFRNKETRWSDIKTITHTIITPNNPPRYAVDDVYDATYTKEQLQVVTKETEIESEFGEDDILPEINDKGDEQYYVEKIVGKKKVKRQWKVEVKWTGFKETTWEPLTTMRKEIPDMVKEYEDSLKKPQKKK